MSVSCDRSLCREPSVLKQAWGQPALSEGNVIVRKWCLLLWLGKWLHHTHTKFNCANNFRRGCCGDQGNSVGFLLSFLLLCGSWGLNSGPRICQQITISLTQSEIFFSFLFIVDSISLCSPDSHPASVSETLGMSPCVWLQSRFVLKVGVIYSSMVDAYLAYNWKGDWFVEGFFMFVMKERWEVGCF